MPAPTLKLSDRQSVPETSTSGFPSILELSSVSDRESLNAPGEAAPYVSFPLTAVVSLVTHLADGSALQAATTGNEGMVGLRALLENRAAPIEAVVRIPGDCLRMLSAKFRAELPGLHARAILVGPAECAGGQTAAGQGNIVLSGAPSAHFASSLTSSATLSFKPRGTTLLSLRSPDLISPARFSRPSAPGK